jgi:hypothetical protein
MRATSFGQDKVLVKYVKIISAKRTALHFAGRPKYEPNSGETDHPECDPDDTLFVFNTRWSQIG